MKTLPIAIAGLISLAASAQIPTPPSAPSSAGMKESLKGQADTAIDKGHGAADAKAEEGKSAADAKTDSAKAGVDAKAGGVPVAGAAVQEATTAGSKKAKSSTQKAQGTSKTKTAKGSTKAHKKVEELAK